MKESIVKKVNETETRTKKMLRIMKDKKDAMEEKLKRKETEGHVTFNDRMAEKCNDEYRYGEICTLKIEAKITGSGIRTYDDDRPYTELVIERAEFMNDEYE